MGILGRIFNPDYGQVHNFGADDAYDDIVAGRERTWEEVCDRADVYQASDAYYEGYRDEWNRYVTEVDSLNVEVGPHKKFLGLF